MQLLVMAKYDFIGIELVESLLLNSFEFILVTNDVTEYKELFSEALTIFSFKELSNDEKFLKDELAIQIVNLDSLSNFKMLDQWSKEGRLKRVINVKDLKKYKTKEENLVLSCSCLYLYAGFVFSHLNPLVERIINNFRRGFVFNLMEQETRIQWIALDDLINIIKERLNEKEYLEGDYLIASRDNLENKRLKKYFEKFLSFWFKMPVPSFLKLVNKLADDKEINIKRFEYDYATIDQTLLEIFEYKRLAPVKSEKFHYKYKVVQFVNKKPEEIFSFFTDAQNLEKITPPLLNFKILSQSTEEIHEGTEFVYRLKVHGIPIKWKTLINNWMHNERFTDTQMQGPYQTWNHTHYFYPVNGGTLMIDIINYSLPLGLLGEIFGKWLVKKDIKMIFNYRKKIINEVFS